MGGDSWRKLLEGPPPKASDPAATWATQFAKKNPLVPQADNNGEVLQGQDALLKRYEAAIAQCDVESGQHTPDYEKAADLRRTLMLTAPPATAGRIMLESRLAQLDKEYGVQLVEQNASKPF